MCMASQRGNRKKLRVQIHFNIVASAGPNECVALQFGFHYTPLLDSAGCAASGSS